MLDSFRAGIDASQNLEEQLPQLGKAQEERDKARSNVHAAISKAAELDARTHDLRKIETATLRVTSLVFVATASTDPSHVSVYAPKADTFVAAAWVPSLHECEYAEIAGTEQWFGTATDACDAHQSPTNWQSHW